jgi:putative flippase GtrA
LHVFSKVVGFHYLAATAAAVETTLIHNFLWHRYWTWADRVEGGAAETLRMLTRYNLTSGLVSAFGNLVFMHALVERARLPVVTATLLAIGICSIANFVLADRVVFPSRDTAEQAAR